MRKAVELVLANQKHDLEVKEFDTQRVVTFRDIDELHQRPEGTARKRFNDNKEHFINGLDYFVRNADEARKEFGVIAPNGLVLLTESGYLMLCKSFTDDLAWQVQRQVVTGYFRSKDLDLPKQTHMPDERKLRMELFKAAIEHEARLESVEQKIDEVARKVDEQIRVDSSEALLIRKTIARKVHQLLPDADKDSRKPLFKQAYNEIHVRWGVTSYRDVRRTELPSVLKYIDAWVPKIII